MERSAVVTAVAVDPLAVMADSDPTVVAFIVQVNCRAQQVNCRTQRVNCRTQRVNCPHLHRARVRGRAEREQLALPGLEHAVEVLLQRPHGLRVPGRCQC